MMGFVKHTTQAFLFLFCFAFLAVDAKSQFLSDSELNVDLYGYGRYMSADRGRDVKALIGSLGVAFKSGYYGFIGVDAGIYMNLGYGKGGTMILEPDSRGGEEHRVLAINLAAIKLRFEGDGLRWDIRGGFTPINVGSLGTAGGYKDYTPVNTSNLGKMRGLHSYSYTGLETTLEVIQDRLELSYGIANKYSPEWYEGMRGSGVQSFPRIKRYPLFILLALNTPFA